MPRKPTGKRQTTDGKTTVRGKAGNGEGTVYYHATVDAWRASYVVNGKRKWVQGPTQKVAVERRDKAVAEGLRVRKGPTRFTAKTTVRQFADWWLNDEVRHRVRSSTLDEARTRINRLGPLLDEPVVAVTLEGLISWQSDLLARLAARTVANTRVTVCQMFRRSVQIGLLPFSPAAELLAPTVDKEPGRALTVDEATRLITATSALRYGPVVHLLYTQGPRVSEALGLSWDDIDFTAGTVVVRRAVTHDKLHGLHLGPPKTKGAKGVHYLAPGVMTALKAHRRRQSTERLACPIWRTYTYEGATVDLVFTQEDGALVSRQHIDTMVRRIARTIDIDTKGLGTHAGRRTVITALHEAGASDEDIARHVGHASPTTTRGYFARHGDRPRDTAALAARLLDNAKIG